MTLQELIDKARALAKRLMDESKSETDPGVSHGLDTAAREIYKFVAEAERGNRT